MVFEFANQYYYSNKLERLDSFSISDDDFERFKKMSVNKNYNSEDKAQEGIDHLKNILAEEGLEPMTARFETLNETLKKSKLKLTDQFKEDIIAVLEREIIKRYFYRDGMYTYLLSNNTEIFKAQEIINDVKAYQNILK